MPIWLAIVAALPVSFELPDGKGYLNSLSTCGGNQIVVLAFIGEECPVARRYAARLAEIARTYDPRVIVIGIDANPDGKAAKLGLPYKVLYDRNQTLMSRLGVTRQPEVFVLDRARVVRYRGRVDDQYSPGSHKPRAGRADLVCAIEELLAGKPVSVPRTEPAGCLIERVTTTPPGVAEYREVGVVLANHCVTCHRSGGIGPFSLNSPDDAKRWAGAIREAVAARRMPPWHADPRFGRFANDPSLNEDERRTILAWAASGGPACDVPASPASSVWAMHKPDIVVSMPKPFAVPRRGEIPYQVIEVDPGFRQDTWVQEAEIRPGNRAVVHHATVYLKPPGSDSGGAPGELQSFCLCAYAAGTSPMQLPDGMAKRVPAGWKLVFVIHYIAKGSNQVDLTAIGLKLLPASKVKREVATNLFIANDIAIPPRCPDYVVTRSRTFERDVLLLALFPHMHARGVSFRYEATYPDGRRETLLSVPRWDMDWQHRYVLAEPLRLPAGTTLTATAHYDNSAANPNNPDPDAEVHTGLRAEDEMFNGYYDICLADIEPEFTTEPRRQPWSLVCWAALLLGLWIVLRRRGQ